ncbi:MAG: DUF2007 domain-containing protein [Bacteroidales bacterium]|nr:DUF2007 domain-containing protein [Bacteroidales bacterium]
MLKIVAEYIYEYEAEIAKGLLESEGIDAMVSNVNSPYPGVLLGKHGVQLLVNDYDLESAQMILENARNAEPTDPTEPADEA